MRVLFLSKFWTIALCFILWGIIQVGAALVCISLPDRYIDPDSFFYRAHKFERNGELYNRVFKVQKWKGLLPDGGAAWKKNGFRKKNLKDFSVSNLNTFLLESARGEMTHWLAMSFFWVFGFFTPTYVLWMMLSYALAVNLPCIIAQRYNRPRVKRILEKKKRKDL